VSPDLVPLAVAAGIVVLAIAGLAAFGSRRARFRSPSAAAALGALHEVVEPEVEHRVEAERRAEETGDPAGTREAGAGGPR